MPELFTLPTQADPSVHLNVLAAQHRIDASIDIHASAERVFSIWADVARWHTWDPDTRSAAIDGAFASGAQGKLAPSEGMAVKMLLTSVQRPHEFTAECSVLGSRMRFPHRLIVHAGFVRVTHSVEFQGWLKGLLMRSVGQKVVAGLPLTLTRLKALAELN